MTRLLGRVYIQLCHFLILLSIIERAATWSIVPHKPLAIEVYEPRHEVEDVPQEVTSESSEEELEETAPQQIKWHYEHREHPSRVHGDGWKLVPIRNDHQEDTWQLPAPTYPPQLNTEWQYSFPSVQQDGRPPFHSDYDSDGDYYDYILPTTQPPKTTPCPNCPDNLVPLVDLPTIAWIDMATHSQSTTPKVKARIIQKVESIYDEQGK